MAYNFDEKKHIHLLDGSPLYGTSTVIKEVMPPFLAKWGAQCAVDYIRGTAKVAELEKGKNADTVPDVDAKLAALQGEYLVVSQKQLDESVSAWSKVRKEAADKGTDMHAELENYISLCLKDNGTPIPMTGTFPAVDSFSTWAVANVDRFIASEVNTYSKELWVGGIVDCVAKLKDGRYAVIDFKSSKEAYFNQFAQAAGYALQLEESGYGNADGSEWKRLDDKILALIVVPFGGKTLKPEMIENVEGYKEVFKSLVNVYGFLNSFNKK